MGLFYTSSNAPGGGTGAIDDEWTLQEAADNAIDGDLVLIKADGVYAPSLPVDFDINLGDNEDPPIFRGANSDGSDDGTIATISGSGITSDAIFKYDANIKVHFANLRLTAGTASNIYISNNTSGAALAFLNCEIDNAAGDGILNEEGSDWQRIILINCDIHDNGGKGYNGSASYAKMSIQDCKIHDNAGDGVQINGTAHIHGCLVYNNVRGLDLASSFGSVVKNCIFFGNSSHGVETNKYQGFWTILNNIFRSNGGYGLYGDSTPLDSQYLLMDYNCWSNNTSGNINWNSGTPPGDNNILTDPLFTSEVAGSEDFTLQSSSPCLDAGFGYDGAA